MGRLDGKVAIITGAGSGVGRAAALLFAAEGAKVIVADNSTEGGRGTEALVRERGGEALFVPTDVTDAGAVQRLVREAVVAFGKIDVLYNNAGIPGDLDNRVTDLTEEGWHRLLDVNLKSVFLCCKYAIPEMVKTGGGSIVNTASTAGMRAMESTAYAVSKAGVISLTKSAARQYAKEGIRVNAICPGGIDTPFRRNFGKRVASGGKSGITMVEPMLGRIAKPEEIAPLALFLASDESSYITGAVYVVDGGATAR